MARRRLNQAAVVAGGAAAPVGYKILKDFYKPVRRNIIARIDKNTRSHNRSTMDSGPSHVRALAPTTYQHDTRLSYKRRRAPRRIRKRAQRVARRFEKNLSTLLGCKRLVLNDYYFSPGTPDRQNVSYLQFMNSLDLAKAFALFGASNDPTSVSYNFNTTEATELLLRNVRAEVEIKNVSNYLGFFDIYYWYPRKDTAYSVNDALFQNVFGAGTGNQNTGYFNASNTLTLSTALNINTNGVTPFDYPVFTENFVIYKVRRVMLQGGQSFSFDIKSRPGNQSSKDWFNVQCRKNITSGVIIISQGEVNSLGNGTSEVSYTVHRQLFGTMYRQGGKGATSSTFVGTGLTT
ncbi:capsid protein [Cressdnaviricota sp.]|nr:capsid protein [Cressdnaviricota sp.]